MKGIANAALGRTAMLCLGLALSGARADAACTQPFLPDPENGTFRGCCDGVNMLAQGSPCVDETLPCKMGTCQADGTCGGTLTNRTGGVFCRSAVNPCMVGDCSNGNCSGPFDLAASCEADGNDCTDDCRPNDATTEDTYDIECGPFVVQGRVCSRVNGTASCENGFCDAAGACLDDPTEAPVACDGNIGECERFICTNIVNGDPVCQKVAQNIGMNCETAPKPDSGTACNPSDPDYDPTTNAFCQTDCREKTCKDNGNCTWNYKQFQGWVCEDDTNMCTKGTCNANGDCPNSTVQNLPNSPGRPCQSDGNVCTLDQCTDGTCTHGDDQNVADGTSCTSTNSCAEAATCSGASCVITDCHENDKNCMNCASAPCNGGAPITGCGCGN